MVFNPLFLKSATLTIDGAPVADEVSNVTFTPTSSALTFKGISGKTSQSQGSEAWAVALTYAQDWGTPTSLARTLYASAGETVEMVFSPTGDAGPDVTATVTLVAGAIGGAIDAAATSTVSLPVTGRPQIVDPAPAV